MTVKVLVCKSDGSSTLETFVLPEGWFGAELAEPSGSE